MDDLKLITVRDPKAPISEAYKRLRTNIQFSSFDKKIKVILITSACPGEGKSVTAANLAAVMAQSGNKTLLIDCDQRKPSVHKMFGLSNTYGLSNLLVGNNSYQSAIMDVGLKNLQVLTSGLKPPNPSELLGSMKMNQFIDSLRDIYDYIILDTPPVLIVTDAQVLSKYSDGCLFVVSSAETKKEAVIKGKEALEKVNAKILGVVINKMKVNSKDYYDMYGYYDYKNRKRKRKMKKANKGRETCNQ